MFWRIFKRTAPSYWVIGIDGKITAIVVKGNESLKSIGENYVLVLYDGKFFILKRGFRLKKLP